ncbi:hypothetical protein BH10BAC4_BH10BAC4_13520 [soil metagenome]
MNSFLSYLIFFVLTILVEILGTLGGFGSSIFFVSTAQLFYDFQTVLALTGLLHVFSNSSKLFLFWNTIDWKLVLWLGVSSVILAIVGAYLTTIISFQYARLVLGIFLIVFSIILFIKPALKITPTLSNSILSGGLAGFLAGFVGTGGAIRGVMLASFSLKKNMFVGTSAAIDFGVDLTRSIIYLDSNYLKKGMLWYIPLLLFASFIGSYIGKQLLEKISQDAFRKILLSLILLMGILLIVIPD